MRSNAQLAAPAAPAPRPAFRTAFARDVLAGLSQREKSVPCTWLYDRAGSELFERITELPEYYPARTEVLILRQCAGEIAALAGRRACVVELGSGSSRETPLLLSALDDPAGYVPVDVSAELLHASVAALRPQFPGLAMHPVVADFNRLRGLPAPADAAARRLAFFPGSTIGNHAPAEAVELLRRIARLVGGGGMLVLGADATLDPSLLLPAYDDPEGVTAALDKNLLRRMNCELDADFDIDSFRHAARLDTRQRRVEMHLVSRREQWVRVAGERFHFAQGESIRTQNAYKYGVLRIQSMAARAGWTQRQLWTDAHARYGVHVFERSA